MSIILRKYIKRTIDSELEELLVSLPSVLIEGPKAVGKTESAKRLALSKKQLDSPSLIEVGKSDATALLTGEKPILIDEWQRVPEVWDAIRREIDISSEPNQYILTGSAGPKNPPTHSGAGRIVSVRMRPLSLFERQITTPTISLSNLLEGKKGRLEGETKVNLIDYVSEIVKSGFPGLRHLSGRPLRAQLEGYINRIIDQDFKDHGLNTRNPEAIKRWMRAYAAATSTTSSYETIRDASTSGEASKPSKSTLIPYREVLERLWVLDPVPAWLPNNNQLGALAHPPKHHLADPALSVQLLGLDAKALLEGDESNVVFPRNGTLLGHLFESLVTLSVRVAAQQSEAKVKHLRTARGKQEVDLIVERRDQKVLAIEVKLNSKVDSNDVKHLLWLKKKLGQDLLDAIIINTGPIAYRRPDGIGVIPAALLCE